jgi:hypothetical protein
MKQLAVAFLTILLTLSAAQARDWESANGETYDVYMLQPVRNADDEFAIMGFFLDTEGDTLNEVVDLADQFFEEALVHFAADNNLDAAVVRFSPPGDYPESELPPVIVDVRYETYDGQEWERVNYPEVPVGESPLFPNEPTSTVTLSSGEELIVEPATVLYEDDRDRRELNFRAVYPVFVMDEANGNRVMAMLWDEVVRALARREAVNNVSVAIYAEEAEGRFDYRQAYAGVFTKDRNEGWPTYERMSEADAP